MSHLEYSLKFILNSNTLQLDSSKEINSQSSVQQFNKKHDHLKIISAFIQKMPEGMCKVPVFSIDLGPDIKHKAYHVRVAVGSSILVSREYAMNCQSGQYDSYIIYNEQYDPEHFINTDLTFDTIQQFRYVIKDLSRILVTHEVNFTYDRELERRSKSSNDCEMCLKNISIMFCLAERAAFCQSCDERVHFNEFTRRHKRYYFNQVGNTRFISCDYHTDTVVDFFCTKCEVPVCSQCKVSGNHSEHPFNGHKLIPYIEASDSLHAKMNELKASISKKEEEMHTSIKVFRNEVQGLRNMIMEVREKIENEYKSIMNELTSVIKTRFKAINAIYVQKSAVVLMAERIRHYAEHIPASIVVKAYKTMDEQKNSIVVDTSIFKQDKIILKGNLSIAGEERRGFNPNLQMSAEMYVESKGNRREK